MLGEHDLDRDRDREEQNAEHLEEHEAANHHPLARVLDRGAHPTPAPARGSAPACGRPLAGRQRQPDHAEQAAVGDQRRAGPAGRHHRPADRRAEHEAHRESGVRDRVPLPQEPGRGGHADGRGAGQRSSGERRYVRREARAPAPAPARNAPPPTPARRTRAPRTSTGPEAPGAAGGCRGARRPAARSAPARTATHRKNAGRPEGAARTAVDEQGERQRADHERQLVQRVGSQQPPVCADLQDPVHRLYLHGDPSTEAMFVLTPVSGVGPRRFITRATVLANRLFGAGLGGSLLSSSWG